MEKKTILPPPSPPHPRFLSGLPPPPVQILPAVPAAPGPGSSHLRPSQLTIDSERHVEGITRLSTCIDSCSTEVFLKRCLFVDYLIEIPRPRKNRINRP